MSDDTAADVRRLLAHEGIRQLVARYAVAIDSRDLDALVALFVDDVQVGKDARGRDALRAFFDGSLREIRRSILNVGTHVIDLVDDHHATGVVYCRGEIEVPGEGGEPDRWVVQAIQYRDDYEQRDGRWLFVRRRHLLWYGRVVGTSPIGLPPAEWPAHHVGTGELPEAWGSWREFWATDGGDPAR